MADLGTAVETWGSRSFLRSMPQLPVSRVAHTWGDPGSYLEPPPLFSPVDSPVPGAGLKALECYTPGTFTRYRPVDAGTQLTVSVKCRKNADYRDTSQVQLGTVTRDTRPYVEVTLPGGTPQRVTKSATVDAYETLTVGPLTVSQQGVAVIKYVAEGTYGDNLLFVDEARRPSFPGPKCWWADEAVSAA